MTKLIVSFCNFANVPKNMVTVGLAVMTLLTPRGAKLCHMALGLSTLSHEFSQTEVLTCNTYAKHAYHKRLLTVP
jgi:hypothetical protein